LYKKPELSERDTSNKLGKS